MNTDMKVGLRIDVDTYRGTKIGVPNLCRLFAAAHIKGSFFFSVGPDNMGRHLWRLLRPVFLWKMLRTRAASLYGWDILLRGTFRPGPIIGEKLSGVIRDAADAGHEIGLHAWDHHAWQSKVESMQSDSLYAAINRGVVLLTRILGKPPVCSAAPAWKCNDRVLLEKEKFPFCYNSDCRGDSIFYPVVSGRKVNQPQIPVTLPTYDEVTGHHGICDGNYNEFLLSQVRPGKLNVLTIHAEVEGIVKYSLFKDFLKISKDRGISFVPLCDLLQEADGIATGSIQSREISGRQGWTAYQQQEQEPVSFDAKDKDE